MKEIGGGDKSLLEQVKWGVLKEAGLSGKEELLQKDYDFLTYFIEEKSGERISLSTLKRIWKNEHNRLPHISTLNALGQTAFKKDWHELKARLVGAIETDKNVEKPANYIWTKFHKLLIALLVFTLVGYLVFQYSMGDVEMDKESVSFSARTSVENKIPNTVIFEYDVSGIEAEQFYLQQSWDPSKRVKISKENRQQTDIYYTPGLHFAKLIADTTVLKEIPVHIKLESWFAHAMQGEKDYFFNKDSWLKNDRLGIAKFSEEINREEPFGLAFYMSKDFQLSGDHFVLKTTIKMSENETVACPRAAVVLKGENDYLLISLIKQGCESEAYMKLSEKVVDGKTNDLTALGTNLTMWQTLEIEVKNKAIFLNLNGEVIYENEYKNDIGSLKEITYIFNDEGQIDDVLLSNEKGVVVYEDNFNR